MTLMMLPKELAISDRRIIDSNRYVSKVGRCNENVGA